MRQYLFILLATFLFVGCSNAQNSTKVNLTASEFSKELTSTKDVQLVDVRTPEEFEKGHVKNAININLRDDDFGKRVDSLDKDKPVFVYCLSGGRSSAAAKKMVSNGFKDVREMEGGMMQWRAANLPEVAEKQVAAGMSLAQYQALVNSDKIVLVDFYADWCAPCKKMKPYLDKISDQIKDKLTLVRIDADANPELMKALKVEGLPVLKLYKKNTLTWDNEGFVEEAVVREKIGK
ncbi:thioredoxin 1 [Pedobacter sp. UYP30]|uniref:thioredoxin domain-containing protein n=1 Tax=Pedobacter sp. UYP30 TaxID=1756400 RepID=UPI0033929943